MGALVAVLQNDPNLLPCQVRRLEANVSLSGPGQRPDAYGFGYYRGNDVLLGKRPSGAATPFTLSQLAGTVESEALIAHARHATVGTQKDENTHPFRWRSWLFAHDGTIESFRDVKPRLVETLPDYLRRNVSGDTDSEHAFMLFLKHMRETGRVEDIDVDAATIGRALARTIREIETWSREAGAPKASGLNFVVTNGRSLAASRRNRPLHYALLEGILPCPRCVLGPTTAENDPRIRPHRQVKAVCFATQVHQPGGGFIEVPEASVVTVSRTLQVAVNGLASV